MRRKWFWFLVIAALILLGIRLWWLSLAITFVGTGCFLLNFMKGKNQMLKAFKPVIQVFIILFSVIFIRLFLIEVYQIPSDSMKDTLITGDKILVEKLTYGPHTPVSPFEVPWVNLLFYLNKNARTKIDSIWWEPGRLKGTGALRNGDVIVFRRPEKKEVYFIKRCIGLPGDTISIKNGIVFINHKQVEFGNGMIRNTYRFERENQNDLLRDIGTIGITPYPIEFLNDSNMHMDLSIAEYENIVNNFPKIKIGLCSYGKGEAPYCFPKNPEFNWNIDQFGPVLIPGKGTTVEMNRYNFNLYRKVLNRYEKRKIQFRDSVFYDGDSPITHYTFRNDYFFVLGDNRKRSHDSRYMGFIPLEGIEGKARVIIWSNENGHFKNSRLFKRIK